ncbi:hypothetical protein [Nitrosomonas communis]|uniref:hypothetical protein n=1 Tax=Nitrosomonas communis TaxID=44574 RepID=UPI0011E85529|nr:hypothetical protein [Nitrosomonas communis]
MLRGLLFMLLDVLPQCRPIGWRITLATGIFTVDQRLMNQIDPPHLVLPWIARLCLFSHFDQPQRPLLFSACLCTLSSQAIDQLLFPRLPHAIFTASARGIRRRA